MCLQLVSGIMRHFAMRHRVIVPGVTTYTCVVCQHMFNHVSEYVQHISSHYFENYDKLDSEAINYLRAELDKYNARGKMHLKSSFKCSSSTNSAVSNMDLDTQTPSCRSEKPEPENKGTPKRSKSKVALRDIRCGDTQKVSTLKVTPNKYSTWLRLPLHSVKRRS